MRTHIERSHRRSPVEKYSEMLPLGPCFIVRIKVEIEDFSTLLRVCGEVFFNSAVDGVVLDDAAWTVLDDSKARFS